MTLQEFFAENPKVALAFSGGVDSSYLLYAATDCRAKVRAYYVKSVFQPRFELDDARRLASELGADMKMLDVDILNDPQITANSADRCYYCKYSIFNSIIRAASEDGFSVLIDGTNASDDAGDRPGMRALGELSVRSPLRECGLTKAEVRRLSPKRRGFSPGTSRPMPASPPESLPAWRLRRKCCKGLKRRRTSCFHRGLRIFG